MRLSANPNSPFYRKDLLMRVAVYLDGLRLQNVVEFSEEDRWVQYLATGDDGKFVGSAQQGYQTVMRQGRVVAVVQPSVDVAVRSPLPFFLDWAQGPHCDDDSEP